MKTSFTLIGAHRAGVASLRYALASHPKVVFRDHQSSVFEDDDRFAKGTPDLREYEVRPTRMEDDSLIGDVGIRYAYWSQSIPRLFRYDSRQKLIMLLRNPIDRAYSHWQRNVSHQLEDKDFVSAVNLEPYRLRNQGWHGQHKYFSYLDQGFYSRQIEHIYQYFDPHQVLFIRSEDFADNFAVVMYQICEFLDLPYIEIDEVAREVGNYAQSMPPEVYNELIEIYRRDVYRMEELLGWNCSHWLEPQEVRVPQQVVFQQS